MATARLSTFVNSDGNVVLAWAMPVEGIIQPGNAVVLTPEAAQGLGRTLVMQSQRANEVHNLFQSVDDILLEADSGE